MTVTTTGPKAPLTVPVLFIAFNRYDTARKVMEAIRAARPPRLYFACDGPRNEAERERCERVRSLVELVDWDCEVKTRFSDVNLGVRMGEATAMTWFWENEEEGIVLEDDTLPGPSFFPYCQELLARYRNDERVWCIMGTNFMASKTMSTGPSYRFSAHGYGAYWGWAGWRRVWQRYDVTMSRWPAVRDSGLLNGFYLYRGEAREAHKLFHFTHAGNINSWDFQFDLDRILNHALAVVPSVNLVRNLGFGVHGTHTTSEKDPRNIDNVTEMPFPLVHPEHMLVDVEWERAYFARFVRPDMFRRAKYFVRKNLPSNLLEMIRPTAVAVQRMLGLK